MKDTNNNELSKREKARLKEMQRLKKEKIQEILDAQNASIDADMVRQSLSIANILWKTIVCIAFLIHRVVWQNNKGKGRLKYLLQQTELFAHFAKADQSATSKGKGR